MASEICASVRCTLVGEYTDEAENVTALTSDRRPVAAGQVPPTRMVASFADVWTKQDGVKDFTVLLHDGTVASVRGHGLKCVPDSASSGETASYGIVLRTGGEETLVALFPVREVSGIFSGEIRTAQKSA